MSLLIRLMALCVAYQDKNGCESIAIDGFLIIQNWLLLSDGAKVKAFNQNKAIDIPSYL